MINYIIKGLFFHKNVNLNLTCFERTMSPSQWQFSGSCLSLLCSVTYITVNVFFYQENRIFVYVSNLEICSYNCPIRKFRYCGWYRGTCWPVPSICIPGHELILTLELWCIDRKPYKFKQRNNCKGSYRCVRILWCWSGLWVEKRLIREKRCANIKSLQIVSML